MKKSIGLFALALAIAACNKMSEIDIQPAQPVLPSEANAGLTITAFLEPKSPVTRAVEESANEITVRWAVEEHIAILYEINSVKTMADATITAVDGETGEATITFTVDGATVDNTTCTLVYPASAAKADYTGVKTYAELLSVQDGTLNANLDVRVGEGLIQVTTPGLTVTTKPEAQYSIFKFSLTTNGTTPINADAFVVRDESDNFITSVSPSIEARSFFVALPEKDAGAGYKFIVSAGNKKYTKSISLVRAIERGYYYQTPLIMGDGESLPVTNLSGISADYTASDFETLTGTLGNNVKISMAPGATVTLDNADINGSDTWTITEHAGLSCLGDATIILNGTNSVTGFKGNRPGIYIPSGSTLTIQGPGSLTANGGKSGGTGGAGIGGGSGLGCGNIRIESGTITATGQKDAAGIGGSTGNCGDIIITGGQINATGGMGGCGIGSGSYHDSGNITISGGTIIATGGELASGIGATIDGHCGHILINGGNITAKATGTYGPGIGCGPFLSSCSSITITSDVVSVTATKGTDSFDSIGAGFNNTRGCGIVNIGGRVFKDGTVYKNQGGDYLTTSELVYLPPKFSVSSTQLVVFSPGNLQNNPNSTGAASEPYTRAWRFAENQWDSIGSGNVNYVYGAYSYNGWLDIYGWGTWTGLFPNPSENSTNSYVYGWDDDDFAQEPLLTDVSVRGKDWRTLSTEEWTYLFNTRSTSSGVLYAKAKVNNVNGVILLPDNWSTSYHSLESCNTPNEAYTTNNISAADWIRDFEAHGAVFLPVTAIRSDDLYSDGEYGYYWSSTSISNINTGCVNIAPTFLIPNSYNNSYYSVSVRLVSNITDDSLNNYKENTPQIW